MLERRQFENSFFKHIVTLPDNIGKLVKPPRQSIACTLPLAKIATREMAYDNIMKLLSTLDAVKHLKRTGWVHSNVPEPETVASHMYRMAVLAMSLEGQIEGLDIARAVSMCLVHDLAEAIVGDITPHCGISDEEKFDRENQAMQKIASFVPVATTGTQWIELWRDYEAQETLEAKVVKHLDKFDMIAQAFDYERKYGLDLSQFFESTKTAFTMAPFDAWNNELRNRREKWLEDRSRGNNSL
ncbi:unnamed protein product [Cylicocyclus nassatus]|uniref:5'-deoxynucleotidase HDDC2 n=1 Tax=Cylicocyclus nassatus TaxID=53992 RepID=A0AA36GLB1_CYLNA|nr:unnamed protein product [Cylicocyclus nassatus]